MQTNFKRISVIGSFAILLIVLVGNGFLTRREVVAQIAMEARLADSRRMLLELEKAESLLKDAETGQRGFLYTGRCAIPWSLQRGQCRRSTRIFPN